MVYRTETHGKVWFSGRRCCNFAIAIKAPIRDTQTPYGIQRKFPLLKPGLSPTETPGFPYWKSEPHNGKKVTQEPGCRWHMTHLTHYFEDSPRTSAQARTHNDFAKKCVISVIVSKYEDNKHLRRMCRPDARTLKSRHWRESLKHSTFTHFPKV